MLDLDLIESKPFQGTSFWAIASFMWHHYPFWVPKTANGVVEQNITMEFLGNCVTVGTAFRSS